MLGLGLGSGLGMQGSTESIQGVHTGLLQLGAQEETQGAPYGERLGLGLGPPYGERFALLVLPHGDGFALELHHRVRVRVCP